MQFCVRRKCLVSRGSGGQLLNERQLQSVVFSAYLLSSTRNTNKIKGGPDSSEAALHMLLVHFLDLAPPKSIGSLFGSPLLSTRSDAKEEG